MTLRLDRSVRTEGLGTKDRLQASKSQAEPTPLALVEV